MVAIPPRYLALKRNGLAPRIPQPSKARSAAMLSICTALSSKAILLHAHYGMQRRQCCSLIAALVIV